MIRYFLLAVCISLVVVSYKTQNKRNRILSIIISVLCLTLYLYTHTTAYIPVKSQLDKNFAINIQSAQMITDISFDSDYNGYTKKTPEYQIAIKQLNYIDTPTTEQVCDAVYETLFVEPEIGIAVDSIYTMRNNFILDKIFYKIGMKCFTQVENQNNIKYWFLPTMLEPINIENNIIMGYLYTEKYHNVYAFYNEGKLTIVYIQDNESNQTNY